MGVHAEQSHSWRTHTCYIHFTYVCLARGLDPKIVKAGKSGQKVPPRDGLKANNQ